MRVKRTARRLSSSGRKSYCRFVVQGLFWRAYRQADWWSTKAECKPLRELSMALCTLADSPLMSAQATLSALTTSCMDLVVSDSPAPMVT
jgi:hypothetical protein